MLRDGKGALCCAWVCCLSSVRSRSGQPCSPARNGRFARPCARSATSRLASGRSPAQLASFSQVPPGCGPDRGRAWPPWSSSAARPSSFFGLVVPQPRDGRLPPGAFARGPSRDTSSPEYRLPRLAGAPHAHPPNCRRPSRFCSPSHPRSRLTCRSGAFFFALFARRRLLPTPLRTGRENENPVRNFLRLGSLDI